MVNIGNACLLNNAEIKALNICKVDTSKNRDQHSQGRRISEKDKFEVSHLDLLSRWDSSGRSQRFFTVGNVLQPPQSRSPALQTLQITRRKPTVDLPTHNVGRHARPRNMVPRSNEGRLEAEKVLSWGCNRPYLIE